MSERAKHVLAASALSDEEVVQQVLMGDIEQFEVILRRYNQRLYRVVRSMLTNEHEVEDALQETYLHAYIHLAQFAGRASFSTWLTKIAVHEALARLRRQQRLIDADLSVDSETLLMKMDLPMRTPEQDFLVQSITLVLQTAIDSLPLHYRSVFMLRHVEGMSTQEAAEVLDISAATVKVRLHRARKLLRQELYTLTGATSADAFQFRGARCDALVNHVLANIRIIRP